MKKILVRLQILFTLLITLGYADVAALPELSLKEACIPLLETVGENRDEEVILKELKKWNCIIQVQEGDEIPLSFCLSGDILAFKENPSQGKITALQTFFIKVQKGKFSFSLNKEHWKSFLEFFRGQLMITVDLDENKEPKAALSLEHYLR